MAGDGPVLIDSNMVPFREQEKAWEPLSNLIAQDILDGLNNVSVKIGSINGKLYGAAEGFQVRSLISCFDEKDWTYEQYLDIVEKNDSGVLMFCPFIQEGRTELIYELFCRDLYDSYFIDPDNSDRPVDRQKLERVLDDVEKYYDEKYDGSMWRDDIFNKRGVAVPAIFAGSSTSQVLLFVNKGAAAVGYPGKNGSKSYANSGSMLVVRANATEEEKSAAARFLTFLLSYEWQHKAVNKGLMSSFASRSDVISEQMEAVTGEGARTLTYGSGLYDRVTFETDDNDVKKAREYLQYLLDSVSSGTDVNEDYRTIVYEELESYFADDIGRDALEERLNKRVGLLLKEKK